MSPTEDDSTHARPDQVALAPARLGLRSPRFKLSWMLWGLAGILVLFALLGWWRTTPLATAPPPAAPVQGEARGSHVPSAGLAAAPVAFRPASASASGAAHVVSKCVTRGVTTYSEGDCPPHAIKSTIVVEPGINIGQAPRARKGEHRPSAEEAEVLAWKTAECAALREELARIELEAAQPASAARRQTDWAMRRDKVRERQNRLHC